MKRLLSLFLHVFLIIKFLSLLSCDEVRVKQTHKNRTVFRKEDTIKTVVGIEVKEFEAVLPLKLNSGLKNRLIKINDLEPIDSTFLAQIWKIIEPLPPIVLTPQEQSVNYERLHPNKEEEIKEIHFSKSYLQKANLDMDAEMEILLYIGRHLDDKGCLLLIDQKGNDFYITCKIEKSVRPTKETQAPFFQIHRGYQTFTMNHNTYWGAGMVVSDEYVTSFYKVIDNKVENCLTIPQSLWLVDNFESKSYSLDSKYFFQGKDTIRVIYDYKFSVCSIGLLLEKYPKLKNTAIAQEEEILMLKDRDTVSYVWQSEAKRYKAIFLTYNKLNQSKLKSLTTEADNSYLKAFQEDFESIKQKGNKIQKLFLKQIPYFFN